MFFLKGIGLNDLFINLFLYSNNGRIGFSIFLFVVSQSPENRFIILLLKESFLKFDWKIDFVLSFFGVLKALC